MNTVYEIEVGPELLLTAARKFAFNKRSLWEDRFLAGQSCNLSDMITLLIQHTGRFVERYASDLVFELDKIRLFEEPPSGSDEREWVIAIGLRESGVDHNAFVEARMKQDIRPMRSYISAPEVYRKLYLLYVVETPESRFMSLTDATKELFYLQ